MAKESSSQHETAQACWILQEHPVSVPLQSMLTCRTSGWAKWLQNLNWLQKRNPRDEQSIVLVLITNIDFTEWALPCEHLNDHSDGKDCLIMSFIHPSFYLLPILIYKSPVKGCNLMSDKNIMSIILYYAKCYIELLYSLYYTLLDLYINANKIQFHYIYINHMIDSPS